VAAAVCVFATVAAAFFWLTRRDSQLNIQNFPASFADYKAGADDIGRAALAIATAIYTAELWFVCRLAVVLVHIRDLLDRRLPKKENDQESKDQAA